MSRGLNKLFGRQGSKNTLSENKKKRDKNNENGLREFWDNMKHNNICIIEIPEGEEREQRLENFLKK